jgi:hypothetical protein
MIAGEIAYYEDGDETTDVCAEGVTVYLKKDGKTESTTATSTFGEFYFDPIPAGSGKYTVEAELPGKGSISAEVDMGDSSVDTGVLYPVK